MKNTRIDSFFKSDKREVIRENENKIDSISSQHYTNDPIVQLQKPFLDVLY